jgi:anti-anti-sigma factor
MKISHEDYDQLTVLTIQGDMTADQVDLFRRVVDERMNANIRDFVLDVQSMEFIDSKGLETLLWLQEETGDKLGQVRLAGTADNVSTILELTRLAARLDSHATVELAIKSLR